MSFRSRTIRRRYARTSKRLSTSRFFPLRSWNSGVEKAHGRIEWRAIDVLPAEAAGIQGEWPTVRQICRVIRSRQVKKNGEWQKATARGRLSRLQLARRRLTTGVAGRQSRSLADRDHASKQGRHPRRGRLHELLRQRSSKHFFSHRLRSQNPEIRGTLTNPRHRALSGRQKPRNPAVLRFLLNHPDVDPGQRRKSQLGRASMVFWGVQTG